MDGSNLIYDDMSVVRYLAWVAVIHIEAAARSGGGMKVEHDRRKPRVGSRWLRVLVRFSYDESALRETKRRQVWYKVIQTVPNIGDRRNSKSSQSFAEECV